MSKGKDPYLLLKTLSPSSNVRTFPLPMVLRLNPRILKFRSPTPLVALRVDLRVK
jgi:hypothetical protein